MTSVIPDRVLTRLSTASNRVKPRLFVLSFAIALALLGSGRAVRPDVPHLSEASAIAAADTMTGEEVGAALGLSPTTWPVPGGCKYYAEYVDGQGYCMDGVVHSDEEAWELGRRINGDPPSELDKKLFAKLHELEELSGSESAADIARNNELLHEVHEILVQKAAAESS